MLHIRRAIHPELREQIYALRYRAYRRENALDEIPGAMFTDRYDMQPNHVLWAITENDRVVGSIRTMWFDPEQPQWRIPEMDGYAEAMSQHIPAGRKIFSGNRFVTEPRDDHLQSKLPLILLRFHVMTFKACGCEWAVAAVRKKHLPFYERVLHLDKISDGRLYPGLKTTMYLTACDFKKNVDSVLVNTPLLAPFPNDNNLIRDEYRDLWETGLPLEL